MGPKGPDDFQENLFVIVSVYVVAETIPNEPRALIACWYCRWRPGNSAVLNAPHRYVFR